MQGMVIGLAGQVGYILHLQREKKFVKFPEFLEFGIESGRLQSARMKDDVLVFKILIVQEEID